ncbi:MAG: hypothetical protein B7X04_00145 [Parcubacteria group bacterium 21-54-25]|nr:MAG: hypothetical protein B7X04_00145 [Parcubacteria group bacterium 21-54-25]HQU07532.1 DUF2061 domain-containing protein [Candidatus Paceibacterota bacterium]
MPHTETRKRSIAKSISWRIVATILTLTTIWYVTRVVAASIEITSLTAVLSTVVYYFHERAWNRSSWGLVAAAPQNAKTP